MPHTEMIEFDMFLNFKTKESAEAFRTFKIQNINTTFIFPFLGIILFMVMFRGACFSDVKALLHENPVFHVCGYIQKILLVSIATTICIGCAPKQMAFLKNWNRNSSFQLAYDACFVIAGIYGSARLITRVVQGTCPLGTSDWHSQVCNTNGATKELPIETLLGAVINSLAAQVIFRSSTPAAIFLAWIFNLGLINVALYLVESPVAVYINLLVVVLCMTSYEIERSMMQFFVNHTFALASAEANAKLKVELISAQIDEEKRALNSKREMVRHIAHEIRTPLNIVTVATDIILSELVKMENVPPFLFDTLYNCQEACAISCDIVNDLLNFEKLSAGLVTLEKLPVALSTYVQKLLKPFYVSAGAKNLTLDYQYLVAGKTTDDVGKNEVHLDVVEIDSVKMSSVLRNLLSNAIKFAKETITVKVSVDREADKTESVDGDHDHPSLSGHVIISVKDDGAGISSVNVSRLFQEGVQFNANELQKGGGSGFGLFIAKGIVDLHTNSRMWAESEGEGMGATFFVKLPLSDVVLPPPPSLSIICDSPMNEDMSGRNVKLLDTTLRPLLILVVDDSMFTRRITIQLLKVICGDLHTYTFLEAVDGQEAVSFVTQSMEAPTLHAFSHSRMPSVSRRPSITSKPSGHNSIVNSTRVSPVASAFNSAHNSKHVSARASAVTSGAQTPIIPTPTSTRPLSSLARHFLYDDKHFSPAGSHAHPLSSSSSSSYTQGHTQGTGTRHVSISTSNSASPSRRTSKSEFEQLLQRSLLNLNISDKIDAGGVRNLPDLNISDKSDAGGGGVARGGSGGGSGGSSGSGTRGASFDQEHHLRRASMTTRSSTTAQIDIVFMDYNMPRMTGPVATAEMRRWGYTGPIIGLSGDTDVSAFLEAGANAALVKPIHKLQMEGVLRRYVAAWGPRIDDTTLTEVLLELNEKTEKALVVSAI